ncbi:MAG TPA: thioesterase family protein [Myxococcota bacterium]|nr:thioesterase family protein [Myxococcota bacterium]
MKLSDAIVAPDSSWSQGRSLFGGLLSAAALRSMRALVPDRPLRGLQAAFIAPVSAPFGLDATLVRAGKHLSHARASIGDAFWAQATFGHPRASAISLCPEAVELPEEGKELPFLAGVTPEFTRHLRHRWISGGLPFSFSERSSFSGTCAFRDAEPATEEHIVALLDCWPSPVLQMLDNVTNSSTVSWTVQRTSAPIEGDASDDWYFSARTAHADEGYAEVHGTLHDPRGRLVATMQQLVAVFG